MGSMADFSAFSFVQQEQQSGQITEIRGFLCPFGKQVNVSRPLKIEWSIELLVTHFFFLIFPSSQLSKTEEGKLSNCLRLNPLDTPMSTDVMFTTWAQ